VTIRAKSPAFRQGLLVLAGAALVFASAAALECHSVVTASAPDGPLLPSALYGLVLWGWWGLAAAVLWSVAENSTADFFSLRATMLQLLIGPALALAHIWILQRTVEALVVWWPVLGPAGYGSLEYMTWNRFFSELLIYGFAFALIGMVRMKLASQREELRALSLEKQLSAAHLRALQMQIEPHFLFNTLNAIASLVELDRKEQAIATLERLNAILHRTLQDGTPARIRVAQELDLLDDYLAIEQTRFADRLRVDMAVDPEALAGTVPCFLMQPLVENAIRHGISRCEDGGSIHVTVARNGERLRLQVRDTGPGANGQAPNGHGIGLRNTRERLSHLYGERFQLHAAPLDGGGFEVAVELPYEREPA
jgi:two-component sensor histidine kinase